MDFICVDRMGIDCVIGTNPEERTKKQRVYVSLKLGVDTTKAAESDDLKDAVDYFTLSESVYDFVSASEFYLIEKLAREIAEKCLAVKGVLSAEVTLEKPDALDKAENTRIIISGEL